ncbi:MAG: DHA2 family efflux MFS transporter permease subunit [Moorellales bacterium]
MTPNSSSRGPGSWVLPVLVALIGPFMAILDSTIVNVAIPTMMRVFNVDTVTIEWVITIYMLALGVVVPLSGWMGDRLGLRRLYVLSLALFTLGSALCALSWNVNSLIAARVIQALGGGMIMPTVMAMVFRLVPGGRFGSGMGIFGIALLVAPAIGPTLGGYLVEYVGWRWIFTINLPVGLLGILLALAVLPDFPPADAGRIDVEGAVTAGGGLFCLLLALTKGNDWGWRSESTVLLLYASAVLLVLFVYLELTAEKPLLELRVFRYGTFTLANLMLVVVTICLNAGVFYVPLFLQRLRGLGAMETGLLMMPAALVSGLLMPFIGRLYDRLGPRPLSLAGLVLLAYTTYLFHRLDVSTPFRVIQVWLALRSVGMALGMGPVQTAALAVIPPELVGRASAITNIISRVSGSFGIAVLTSVLNRRQALHGVYLAQSLGSANPAVEHFLRQAETYIGGTAAGSQMGRTLGLAYLQGLVAQTAFVRALEDIFVIMACLVLIAILPSLFLKKGGGQAGLGLE